MTKQSASKLLLLFIPAAVFFAPRLACAQQQVDSFSSGSYAPGSISPGAETNLHQSASSPANPEKANRTSANEVRSAWNAGGSPIKHSGTSAPAAGGDSFKTSGASWIAGGDAFSLKPQQGGIWRSWPAVVSQARAVSPASHAQDLYDLPEAGFPQDALSGGKSSSPQIAPRFHPAFRGSPAGSHGPKYSFHARTSLANPYTSHYGNLGIGHGSGSEKGKPPSSESPSLPSLNDTLDSNSQIH